MSTDLISAPAPPAAEAPERKDHTLSRREKREAARRTREEQETRNFVMGAIVLGELYGARVRAAIQTRAEARATGQALAYNPGSEARQTDFTKASEAHLEAMHSQVVMRRRLANMSSTTDTFEVPATRSDVETTLDSYAERPRIVVERRPAATLREWGQLTIEGTLEINPDTQTPEPDTTSTPEKSAETSAPDYIQPVIEDIRREVIDALDIANQRARDARDAGAPQRSLPPVGYPHLTQYIQQKREKAAVAKTKPSTPTWADRLRGHAKSSADKVIAVTTTSRRQRRRDRREAAEARRSYGL